LAVFVLTRLFAAPQRLNNYYGQSQDKKQEKKQKFHSPKNPPSSLPLSEG